MRNRSMTKLKKPFKYMTTDEKRYHVAYLWSRVRAHVLQKSLFNFVQSNVYEREKERTFTSQTRLGNPKEIKVGLDPIDEHEVFAAQKTPIPSYMVHKEGKLMIIW